MLEPEYFQDKCDRMVEMYQELEDYILKDIAQRLLKSGMSGTADRLVWKLEQMGEHRSTILAKLSKLTGLSRQELRDLLQEAVLTSWQDDMSTFNKLGIVPSDPLKNKAVMTVMNAEYIKSMGELENLTRTTLDRSQKDLIKMLDEAEIRVAAGVQSYSSAVCDILDNYAAGGIRVNYPSGTERTLESAVRMAVVTSMNQTSAQITNQYIVEGNIEYVLVSAHLGARPQKKGQPYLAGHENWQGRAYRIRGSEPGFPNLAENTGYDITEDGAGRVINPLGLHGYNCRHSHKPWDKDLKNPYLDENGNLKINTEESRKLYELQQRQRAMERNIRKTKRELLVKQQEINSIAETDVKEMLQPQYDRLAYKLREQNKAYKDFCEQNRLQTQQDRLKAAGFKRRQASMANGRAAAYQNTMKANGAANKEGTSNPIRFEGSNDNNSQSYRRVTLSKSMQAFSKKDTEIQARKVLTYEDKSIYISEKAKVKPKQLHQINQNIQEAQRLVGSGSKNNQPKIIIVSDTEMKNGIVASYRAYDNVMFINENILKSRNIDAFVGKGDSTYTLVHELYHWKDAQRYIRKHGAIDENYLQYNIAESRRKVDKLEGKGYNLSEISEYASQSYKYGRYDEVYTEYRTMLKIKR